MYHGPVRNVLLLVLLLLLLFFFFFLIIAIDYIYVYLTRI